MIDKEFLKRHCGKVNEDKTNSLGDKLIIGLFNMKDPYEISCQDNFSRVCLIDYLWKTHLTQKQKSIYDISEDIVKSLPCIKQKLDNLPSKNILDLELNQSHCVLIKECIEKIRACCDIDTGISFTCKYLHFLEPALFIPWDNSVPKAVNELRNTQIDINKPLEEYSKLLEIYKGIALDFSEEERKEVIDFDYETQKPYQALRKNTFIRIIDKALWGYKKFA